MKISPHETLQVILDFLLLVACSTKNFMDAKLNSSA